MPVDIGGEMRRVERILGDGAAVTWDTSCAGSTTMDGRFFIQDPSLGGRIFMGLLCRENKASQTKTLKQLHEKVYQARGIEVFRRQEGKCAGCGEKMNPLTFHKDHKKSRGANGRDDRMSNLWAKHPECHRMRHEGVR